ncbi:hypothetical protein LG299_12465 [Microbacterium lacus]|uniref:hypothetical protein n=1 Tax=Microbacterium lacus TaxID=415217 RepID=UPI00384FC4BB
MREYRTGGVALVGVPSARNNITAAFNWAMHYGFDPDEASSRQLDAEAARSLDADVYMTDNAYLLHRPDSYAAASVAEALAVIGLHQRLRGRVILGEGFEGHVGTWQAEMIQAGALLPASAQAFREGGSGLPLEATRLVRAARLRLGKALAARDNLLLASMQRTRSFGADEPEDSVERVAVALQGMFDALARALNACLANPLNARHVAWHRREFLQAIPSDSQSVASTSHFKALQAVIGELRNTVHHEPVGSAASDTRGRFEKLVTLPRTSAERFLREVDNLGRRERWVAHDIGKYGLALHPVVLCDDLIGDAAAAANRLLDTFPWTESAGSPPSPATQSDWLTYPPYLATNRLLYGL